MSTRPSSSGGSIFALDQEHLPPLSYSQYLTSLSRLIHYRVSRDRHICCPHKTDQLNTFPDWIASLSETPPGGKVQFVKLLIRQLFRDV
ncbi:MAG: hypothetical protein AAF609_26155 [Cyanobacteria bacterium P01_C01_bin.120]